MRSVKVKKALSVLLALCVFFSGIAVSTDKADAKTVKLSAKSVTIAMGGTKTIKLTGGNGKWIIKNSKVAKLKSVKKKSVVIVPKSAGSTVLMCKVGKKKLQCKIRVLNSEIGKATDERPPVILKGDTISYVVYQDPGESIVSTEYNTKLAKVTQKLTAEDEVTVDVKALKPGNLKIKHKINTGQIMTVEIHIIPGFRGKTKVKKSETNYKKWRQAWIKEAVSKDMSTWEIIDEIGTLISSGKYSSKGGATGMQLWYGGNGTCVSGAVMMNDFLKDLGISSKVRFAGKDGAATDIYGYTIFYMSKHKNTKIKLGGKSYILNPQPGMEWPLGIIAK